MPCGAIETECEIFFEFEIVSELSSFKQTDNLFGFYLRKKKDNVIKNIKSAPFNLKYKIIHEEIKNEEI